ncbi:hypothetical protein C3O72_10575 [Cronobacter sakazakii]|uniref:hypothetical protein n=1 Tax=Cronobacter sakazakii TaxID=28141 RepID=UPI000F5EEFB4|nr:hypothetical protein [Cronobacter sakazakii]RRA36322.1 hypothetical protein C3O72_10575 [Cronobacter sakazakii]
MKLIVGKVIKIGIYCIWGIFLLLASIEKFGDFFAVGTGFWSVLMLFVAGICQLVAAFIAIGWAVLAFGTMGSKYLPYKFVNNYTVPVLIIVLAFVASAARSSSDEARAQKLGFKDGKEFSIARENNISNVADYAKFAEEQRIKAAEKAAQDAVLAAEKTAKDAALAEEKERKKKEDEAQCNKDAYCYYTHHENAEYLCSTKIPKLAKYKFEWTDGITEPKFDRTGWQDETKHIVRISGDKATAQNGFGATQNIVYYCIFNADTGDVLDYGFY